MTFDTPDDEGRRIRLDDALDGDVYAGRAAQQGQPGQQARRNYNKKKESYWIFFIEDTGWPEN